MAFLDRLGQAVTAGGGGEFEETQRIAYELPVFRLGEGVCRRRAGRCREAELDRIEVPQHAAPLAVDRAVALGGDDQIEIARRERAELGDHGLPGRHGDALGPVELPAGPPHVTGIVPQMVGERVFGLPRQGDPVHQEQHPGDDARLEPPLDDGRRRARLAGARRHLDQQLAPPARALGGQRLKTFDLVGAVDDFPVDHDLRQVAPPPPDGDPPLQVGL